MFVGLFNDGKFSAQLLNFKNRQRWLHSIFSSWTRKNLFKFKHLLKIKWDQII